MTHSDPLQPLQDLARQRVEAVADDPAGRYRLRETFYRRWGFADRVPDGRALGAFGFGASELAFLRYEIERGVLNPVQGKTAGSRWWRAVNTEFLYVAELAGLIAEAGQGARVEDPEVRYWLDYFARPSGPAWYRAHNTSIIRGYLGQYELALAECADEQLFMNEVLYRLLFAEAMEMGVEAGVLGEIGADPCLFGVDFMVHCKTLYPRCYPLTERAGLAVRHLGHGLEADFGRLLDRELILPHLDRLYALVSTTVDQPGLQRLIKNGVPVYPTLATAAAGSVPALADVVPAARSAAPPGPAGAAARKQRILILGAGMGGLSTAYELTNYPGWQDLYEVVVHVQGWRVGGKTATGRGPADRVEEHGIHILQGWYHNLFRTMNEVFQEHHANPSLPPLPWPTWYDALVRNNSTLLTQFVPEQQQWINTTMIFPETPGLPGEGPPLPLWDNIKKAVAVVLEMLLGSPYAKDESRVARWILDHFFPPDGAPTHLHDALRAAEQGLEHDAAALAEHAMHAVRSALDRLHLHPTPHAAAAPVDAAAAGSTHLLVMLQTLLERLRNDPLTVHGRLRLLLQSLELVTVSLRGILADVWDPSTHTFRWSRVDGEDFRAWLTRWGATELVLTSPLVRFAYTGLFANLVDGHGRGGLVSAGALLRCLSEAAGYRGSFVFQLRAGTGDTMILPLYEVLAARGVRFEFFRQVEQVHATADGRIEAVTVGEQVTLRNGRYDPVRLVGEVRAWPAEPLYDQIDPDQARLLRERGVDLEDPWSNWTNVRSSTLTRGTHFDQVVLAIPVGALADCCSDLVRSDPRWQQMVAGVKTTGTLAVQLWVSRSLEQLGMNPADWGLAANHCAPNVVTYQDLLYSWLDQSCVLPFEQWPQTETPRLAAYFTGTLDDPATLPPYSDHGFPARQRERVKGIAEQWLQSNMAFFWPDAATLEFPGGFDTGLLCSPRACDATPAARLEAQFFRANLSPTMRYTLSVPGSSQFRLRPDDSGYANLFLAGDWTDFGLNVGYIEGALISGLQAAQALRQRCYGQTAHRTLWTDPQSV